ncbi:TIGR04149 family rSAM-modified RiPP [Paraprevotella clara]|uniref:TIGR04149 family rSAM-modified RiPP n=1 Tax=Paraprevotella clara TaxID=454154 RepID=UPI002676D60D|nr:TIGR04149 family rSAM-modified RiPP [Paraprevotella clara]
MVKIKKLTLHALEHENLSDNYMRCLMGGSGTCTCGCHYANAGGASSSDNDAANYNGGYTSYGGGSESCGCAGSNGASTSAFWKGYE